MQAGAFGYPRIANCKGAINMKRNPQLSVRTSQSHPLFIAEVGPTPSSGRIGITLCPGKKQRHGITGTWDRDLNADLDGIRDWGACAVVTLIEAHEMRSLRVDGLEQGVTERHMAWHHLPICDVSVPGADFERAWAHVGPQLRHRITNGFNVLIHCMGGLGRAGTIAAKLLVELGWAPHDAITAVRAVRPGAIETAGQERYVAAQKPISAASCKQSAEATTDRALGALFGLAVGDAVGTTLEFSARDSRPRLTDMVGGGPFSLRAGQWTDDTAMALALADSIASRGRIDETDLMQRFMDWRDNGAYSCTGACFDVGATTSAAISRWKSTGKPIAGSTDPFTAGNGSLMRLAPVALRYWRNRPALRDAAERQSRTTHAASAAVSACSAFAEVLADAIEGKPLVGVLSKLHARSGTIEDREVAKVAAGSWRGRARSEVRGSGYVVQSLESAIWSVARSGTFAEAVLTAANLGDDADTTAAIAGQLAGATYGLSGIPSAWLQKLAWREKIRDAGQRLIAASGD